MKVFNWVKDIENPSGLYICLIIFSVLAFFGGVLCGLKTEWGSFFIAPLATFVAAFIGPMLAFSNSRNKSKKDEEERDKKIREAKKQKLNYCSFVLSRYFEILNPVYLDIVKYDDFHDFCLFFPPNDPADHDELKIDYEGLSFLFTYDPNILNSIWLSVAKYEQAIKAIRIRNDFMVNQYAPKAALIKETVEVDDSDEPKKIFGDRIYNGCLQCGESLIVHVPDSRESLRSSLMLLDKAADEIFPEGGVLQPCFPNVEGSPPQVPDIYTAEYVGS